MLRSWRPVVISGEDKEKKELFLIVEAELECPCCKKVFKYTSRKHSFDAGAEFLADWKARDILEPKQCPECGIYFGLPDKEEKSFRQDMEKKLTKEWFEEEIKKYNPQP